MRRLLFLCAAALAVGLPFDFAQGTQQSSEEAYRANNLGVARLEQFDYAAAVAAFREALEKQPELAIARLNLAIAHFYAGDLPAARREAEAAGSRLTSAPQPPFVLGLIAKAENRGDDAVAAFTRVLELDPGDPGAATQLGQVLLQDRKYPEALARFQAAIDAEPYNVTAAYGLAMALTRSGDRDRGGEAMARFQKLRDSGYATTYSNNYLEQGRYAEAIASTGAEAELVDRATPSVRFADVTSKVLPGGISSAELPAASKPLTPGIALADLDGDGDLDVIDADPEAVGLRIFSNDSGRFSDVTKAAGISTASAQVTVAGDYDNDGRTDLAVLGARISLFRQTGPLRFEDATAASALPARPANPRTAAWLDADHDGDLDLLVGGSAGSAGGSLLLARNNGNGTFTDITAAAGLEIQGTVVAVASTDYDNRRDIDIVLLPQDAPPMLMRNMRDGTFRDVAGETGFAAGGPAIALALGDVNKDGFTDAFLGRRQGSTIAVSNGKGAFTSQPVLPDSSSFAAQFVDYDNDGLLDLLVSVSGAASRLLRNLGTEWSDVSATAVGSSTTDRAGQSLAAGDLDLDGDADLVLRFSTGGPIVLQNDGGNKKRSLAVRLAARVSNRSAVGSKVEIRAGSLRQKLETSAASPSVAPADLLFGLGTRNAADVVRVQWPAGILQAETPDKPERTLNIQELDRKPSSCPYLYTWNGERFEFLTDFLGGGELGYFLAPGVRSTPDPDEYVRIDGSQLRERNGRFELRVTNELEETLFLDRAELVAIDHPADVEVHPEEGMKAAPPRFRLHAARGAAPPLAAIDDHGHDVLERISRLDRRYPDDFALEPIRGYARPHSLTLTLPVGGRLLLLTGWTDYAFSSDNFAAHQRGLQLRPPSLEVSDGKGGWRTAIADVGIPVGRPQTVVVDLKDVPASVREVRITTTMRVYWDWIRVGVSDGNDLYSMTRLQPVEADLRWRGFSAESTPDEPYRYDYSRVLSTSPWKQMPGRYTREGDVRPLVAAVDDMFVVSRPGDEIALSFDAHSLRAPRAGWTRTFLLYADGFSKEMNLHSSSPDVVAPLPFHGMTGYPYSAPQAYPSSLTHRRYLDRYNTRIVPRMVPPL
jgi:tetratricopeptide (TPR) repeat protein